MIEIFNRKYCFGIAAVLYLVCFLSVGLLFLNAFNIIAPSAGGDIVAGAVAVISGYFASFFCCLGLEGEDGKKRLMRGFLLSLLALYVITLADFTLIDDGFGRNIFNLLSWNRPTLAEYVNESTNIIPFATIRLFINGYINGKLSLSATVVNILGNFTAFMPIPFFVGALGRGKYRPFKVLACVLGCVLCVELLQLILLTGACDIDDVILNTAGAMLFYYISCKDIISKGINKLTFGVWDLK